MANKSSSRQKDQNDEGSEFIEKTVKISRVSKVVKGGRRFSFSALVVAGDGKGRVGYGLGKSSEVPDAIRKASEQARKSLVTIPLHGGTIPHEVLGKFGPTRIVMKPAAPGTGVIAGSAVRALVEAAGITDIRTKCLGSNNAHNILNASFKGFGQLVDPEYVSDLRGVSLEDLEYAPY